MAAEGHNPGFHMLDDFVCEAVHAPWVPRANPASQARTQGMTVVRELVFAAGEIPDSGTVDTRKSPRHASVEQVIKVEAHRLAAIIATSDDPAGTMSQFEKLLLAEFTSIQQSNGPADTNTPNAGI